MRRIFIAYTGGTIGMRRQADGAYAPEPGYLARVMQALPALHDPAMPAYTVHEYTPLLDSANMTPAHWTAIAHDIEAHYAEYDGFVVLHGTDTMAYTASALAFMLQNLGKPVVLTGAQLPLAEPRSDGRENLITALLLAAHYPIPEVCLCFGSRLLRGCRATKVSADSFEAFDSPNLAPLATIGINIQLNQALLRPPPAPDLPLTVQPLDPAVAVGTLRLFPGISATAVKALLQPLQGLVIEAYGSGNGPTDDAALLGVLTEAGERGTVIVQCTQCLHGTVNLTDYSTGAAFARAGALSGRDMTIEAALAKLLYLFSAGYTPAQVRELAVVSLRGELTE